MGGTESQGISRMGQTVLARLMESQIWYPPASFVALWWEGSENRQWHLPTFLSGRKLSHSSHLDGRHSVSPCMTLVPFKLLPHFWSSEGVCLSKSVCGFFKWNCLGIQKFLFFFFLKYILWMMLLQLSHFFSPLYSLLPCTPHPTSIPLT